MLKLIERRRMPNGALQAVSALRAEHESLLESRDVVQINDDYRQLRGSNHLALFTKQMPPCSKHAPCFLIFRNVDRHDDGWSKVKRGSRYVAPAFLHWVIHGQAQIELGRKRLTVRRGDVFAMDMNKPHSVESRSLCITVCVTVPRIDAALGFVPIPRAARVADD